MTARRAVKPGDRFHSLGGDMRLILIAAVCALCLGCRHREVRRTEYVPAPRLDREAVGR